jgi:hypothetical protein
MALLDEFYTEDQLAAELNRTPRTLCDWRTKRIGPPVTRIGNCPYYRKESVRQWLQAREGKVRAA